VEKRLSPEHVTARQNANGDQDKRVHVDVTLRNTGASDLFDIRATEALPAGFVLKEGPLNATFPAIPSEGSASFAYSVDVPASEVADYSLTTAVLARDVQGVEHSFSGTATLSVQLPPGSLCAPEPADHPGKGQGKGKDLKCSHFFQPSGGGNGGRPDCPPGWLKHSETGACENPGQGNGQGKGKGKGGGE
ncbi:MAG: hypothetical protein QXQ87_09015, partial [Halobacteria archaeon]